MNKNDIISYCLTQQFRITDTFLVDVGKKIAKYLEINDINVNDVFYVALSYYFYNNINNCSVIITKDMFNPNKSYNLFCYENLIDKKNTRCINCIKCSNCTDCINCINCINCIACEECILCRNCSLCTGCNNCDHCIQSKYTTDAVSLNEINNSYVINCSRVFSDFYNE